MRNQETLNAKASAFKKQTRNNKQKTSIQRRNTVKEILQKVEKKIEKMPTTD